jgi:sensor c-di-GMP phosphodiesterase-like protein
MVDARARPRRSPAGLGIVQRRASEAITRSVCELAHRLGLTAVAEGVEDETLAHLMTTFGFDLLQGYHFAKPMAEVELIAFVDAEPGRTPVLSADGDAVAVARLGQ